MNGKGKPSSQNHASNVLLLLILGLLGYAAAEMADISRSLANALEHREMNDEVLVSEWKSGGIKKTYTTTKQPAETQADHAKRHKLGLEAKLVEFPRDV